MTDHLPNHVSEAEFREIAADADRILEIQNAARMQRREVKRAMYALGLRDDLLHLNVKARAEAVETDDQPDDVRAPTADEPIGECARCGDALYIDGDERCLECLSKPETPRSALADGHGGPRTATMPERARTLADAGVERVVVAASGEGKSVHRPAWDDDRLTSACCSTADGWVARDADAVADKLVCAHCSWGGLLDDADATEVVSSD